MPRLSLEPFDPDLLGRALPAAGLAGVAGVLLLSSGDGLFAAVLVGLVAADALAGTVAVLAVLAALARFGTTSLVGLAGAQAVLGPAVLVDPAVSAIASALAALAVVAVAPPLWRGLPFGLLAGLLVVGPSASGAGDALVRLVGVGLGVGAVFAAHRYVPLGARPPWARWAALGVSAAALALTVASS